MSPPDSDHPRKIFLYSLTCGTAMIVLAIWADWGMPARLTALAVMAFYWRWVAQLPKGQSNTEEYADSIYYLGFLLTLIALATTGLKYALSGPMPDSSVLVQQFLLGLVTTIVGLTGKIYFSQFRAIPVEDLEIAHRRLADAVNRIVPQLEDSFEFLRQSRERSSQEMGKISEETIKMIRALIDNTAHAVNEVSDKMTDRIETVLEDFEQRVANIHVPAHIWTAETKTALEAMSQELEETKEVIKGFNSVAKRQSKSVESLLAAIGESASKLNGFAVNANSLSTFSEKVRELQASATSFTQAVAIVTRQIDTYSSQIESHKQGSASLHAELQRELEAIRSRKQEIEQQARQAQEALELVHRNLIDSTKFITQQLGG